MNRIRRARLVPIALTTAALSSAVLGASVTGTLSAFSASITNTSNTAVAGSLVMQEKDATGNTTCLSSSGSNNNYADCGGIDKYGGTSQRLFPGGSYSTTISIANLGASNVRGFTVQPGTCTKTSSATTGTMATSSLCDSAHLTVTCAPVNGGNVGTAVTVYNNVALSSLTGVDLYALSQTCVPASNGANTVRFVFTISLPSGQDNTVQGQQVSQPITWTFTGA